MNSLNSNSTMNLPKVIQSSNPAVLTSINDIIRNENGKPITLNDNSIRRLRKLLNLDEFSSPKEKEMAKVKKEATLQKGKLKNSLSTISESALPQHRTDYTQIVSKVMILKKLSNGKMKLNNYSSKSSSSIGCESQESIEQESPPTDRTANSVMKIIITERPQCTPPRASPVNF